MKKYLIGFISGIIISAVVAVGASYAYHASDISFNPSTSGFQADNVQDAIDEIISKESSKTIKIENIYDKTINNGYGENININYTVPEGVTKLTIVVTRVFAFCTFQTTDITGEGLVSIESSKAVSNGKYYPSYSYVRSYVLNVTPGKTINIKTNETNIDKTSGNYSTFVNAYYIK